MAVAGYGILSLLVTWPLARDFRTYVLGEVHYDIWHAIWVLWYDLEALLGRASWPWTSMLHCPHGISVLCDGVGPVNALLALPFWPWGPVAAFNGAVLLGMVGSAWSQFLLARHAGLDPAPAFFSGALFVAWPVHLAALGGHLEKVFVGLLPLSLYAGLLAFDPRRRTAWSMAPAVVLLLTLLQNGHQLVFAAIALVILGIECIATARPASRSATLLRVLVSGGLAIAAIAPLVFLVIATTRGLRIDLGRFSSYYAPDVAQLVVPAPHQRIASWLYRDTPTADFGRPSSAPFLSPSRGWYGSGNETAVAIPFTAIALMVVAWRAREARRWIVAGAVLAVLSLGPALRTGLLPPISLRVPLPYAALLRVPGIGFIRTPGRFMLMAAVPLALAAGFGLATAMRRFPRGGHLVAIGVLAITLAECWPLPWPQTAPPPLPDFYRELGADPGDGAVLDLPEGFTFNEPAAAYQYYQVLHQRPIAWSYLSRSYPTFPIDGLEALFSSRATDPAAARERLRKLGYRYVVWHKHPELFGRHRVAESPVLLGAPVAPWSSAFIRGAFRGERPVHDDDLVTVYAI
ncbi:MAG: hypothetical protein U0166_04305 [Acidobacteriota bacterium]